MRALLMATGLIFSGEAASAETLSFISVVPPTGYDADAGFGFQVRTPGFNASFGMLDSVSMTVACTVQDSIFSPSGDKLPFAAEFTNVGSIGGDGLSLSGVLSQNFGAASTLLADNSFAVNVTVATGQDLQDYAANAIISTEYAFHSTVTNAATGQLVAYDGG